MSFLNLRMVRATPSIASGGAMTLTREPSSRRASQIGEDFVDAAADLADDALADVHQLRVVAEADVGELDLAVHFDEAARRTVDHDVGDVVAGEQRLERAEAEHVVADVVEQILLLGDRQDQVLDRDDLVDDVADFLARALGIELGERGEIDRLDQRAEDHRLGLKVACPSLPSGMRRRAACRCALRPPTQRARSARRDVWRAGLARLPNMAKAPFLYGAVHGGESSPAPRRAPTSAARESPFSTASSRSRRPPTRRVRRRSRRPFPSARSPRSSGRCWRRRRTVWRRAE